MTVNNRGFLNFSLQTERLKVFDDVVPYFSIGIAADGVWLGGDDFDMAGQRSVVDFGICARGGCLGLLVAEGKHKKQECGAE